MSPDKSVVIPSPALFENQPIRRVYDDKAELWWFSVIDIVQVLTQQPDYQAARNYWKVLKNRLAKEGSQVVTNCNQLKLTAPDGKQRLTDVASAETCCRRAGTRSNLISNERQPTGSSEAAGVPNRWPA